MLQLAATKSQRDGLASGPDNSDRRGYVSGGRAMMMVGGRKERRGTEWQSAPFHTREARARGREDLRLRVRTRHGYIKTSVHSSSTPARYGRVAALPSAASELSPLMV